MPFDLVYMNTSCSPPICASNVYVCGPRRGVFAAGYSLREFRPYARATSIAYPQDPFEAQTLNVRLSGKVLHKQMRVMPWSVFYVCFLLQDLSPHIFDRNPRCWNARLSPSMPEADFIAIVRACAMFSLCGQVRTNGDTKRKARTRGNEKRNKT